jgi:hypothetical protein
MLNTHIVRVILLQGSNMLTQGGHLRLTLVGSEV